MHHRSDHVLQTHALDFWLARGALALVAVLNLALVNKPTPWPYWIAPLFEFALLIPLSVATAWTQLRVRTASSEHHWRVIHVSRRWIRNAALGLTVIVTAINFEALAAVMHGLIHGVKGATGASLLVDAMNIWFTNVVIFALWFWNLDRGGPALRGLSLREIPDLQFPQMIGTVDRTEARWTPGFIDYLFVSFTNATAFSPTDTMPLSARMKLLFMLEAMASLVTVGLVAARAVNILV
jgi:hypothetical protein